MQIENDFLAVKLHPRGAAIDNLFIRALNRNVVRTCSDRNAPHHYVNTIVGPIANRIAGGQFSIDGNSFTLDMNEGRNTLHGGQIGLSELEWDVVETGKAQCAFAIELPDGHMGFPGPSIFKAMYRLNDNSLDVELSAESERKNAFSLAPHYYFNLDGSAGIDSHLLQIHADHYLPVDEDLLPLGRTEPVAASEFDFLKQRLIAGTPLDHNFCLNGNGLRELVILEVDDLNLTIASNQCGVQIFDGRIFNREHIAIEPQGWPNAVNVSEFPSQELPAGQSYKSHNRFSFKRIP
ncbi:MAG: hypothetical protein V6Z81_10520 [Parvularculales bacterium]